MGEWQCLLQEWKCGRAKLTGMKASADRLCIIATEKSEEKHHIAIVQIRMEIIETLIELFALYINQIIVTARLAYLGRFGHWLSFSAKRKCKKT
jgi:hypothetical protein